MSRRAGDFLLHPATLGLLALWALNDHVLKYALHDAWTGKLSDVASLAVFPLLPTAFFELLRARRGRPFEGNRTLLSWCVATGFVMATINVFDDASWCYRFGLGALQVPFRSLLAGHWVALRPVTLTMDPTDLWTLPALGIALAIGWRRAGGAYSEPATQQSKSAMKQVL